MKKMKTNGQSSHAHAHAREQTRNQKKDFRKYFDQKISIFKHRISKMDDSAVKSQAEDLLKDLIGYDGKAGQVEEAFDIEHGKTTNYFDDWGKHFIPSMIHAHRYRECNNFADPGVQNYGSEEFKQVRDQLNDVYEDLPPPKQSHKNRMGTNARQITNMRAYNFSGGCFSGDSFVKNVAGKIVKIEDLEKGEKIIDPVSGMICEVSCLIQMPRYVNRELILFKNSGLKITPFHPVKVGDKWAFPSDLVDYVTVVRVTTNEYVYNVLTTGAAMTVNGIVACTLGHGLTEKVVNHAYFGSRSKIVADLKSINQICLMQGFLQIDENTEYTRNFKTFEIAGLQKLQTV